MLLCVVACFGKSMPSDGKHGLSKPKKRKFCGNQYTKGKETNGNSGVTVRSAESSSSVCETADCVSSKGDSAILQDTPTRSEQKLQHQDLYKLIVDCSSDESVSEGDNESDSESEGNEESCDANVGVETPEGTRIIDVKILGEQISSNLV